MFFKSNKSKSKDSLVDGKRKKDSFRKKALTKTKNLINSGKEKIENILGHRKTINTQALDVNENIKKNCFGKKEVEKVKQNELALKEQVIIHPKYETGNRTHKEYKFKIWQDGTCSLSRKQLNLFPREKTHFVAAHWQLSDVHNAISLSDRTKSKCFQIYKPYEELENLANTLRQSCIGLTEYLPEISFPEGRPSNLLYSETSLDSEEHQHGFKATEELSEIALFGHWNDDQSFNITVGDLGNNDNQINNYSVIKNRNLDICKVEVLQTGTSEDESKNPDKTEEMCLTAIDEVEHDTKFQGERHEVCCKEVEKEIEHEDASLSVLDKRTGDTNIKAEFESQMKDHPVFKKYEISSVLTTTSQDEIIDVISLNLKAAVQSNETPPLSNTTQNHQPPLPCNHTISLTKAPTTCHSPGDVRSLLKCIVSLSMISGTNGTSTIAIKFAETTGALALGNITFQHIKENGVYFICVGGAVITCTYVIHKMMVWFNIRRDANNMNAQGYAQPEHPTDENGTAALLVGGAEIHIVEVQATDPIPRRGGRYDHVLPPRTHVYAHRVNY